MENKYQEALNKIEKKLTIVEEIRPPKTNKKPQTLKEALDQAEGVSVIFECEEELKTLQELVDKATSKKVKPFPNSFYIKICPNCGSALEGKRNYCDECGQKLDWSDK